MSGTPRIGPYFSHEPLVHKNGLTRDYFRKWFQSFADISNEFFITVRQKNVGGVPQGAPFGVFQNVEMTTTQRDDIEPTDLGGGMQIFNTTTNKLQVYDGTIWANLH